MNSKIYVVLFFSGLTSAIIAAARFKEQMPVGEILGSHFFIIGLVIAVIALVLWRKSERQFASLETNEGGASLGSLLSNIISELDSVNKDDDRETLLGKVAAIQTNSILPFIEQKNDLLKKMTVEQSSDVLLKFAYSERLLNRAYSCSADGYHEEGQALIPQALEQFRLCEKMMSYTGRSEVFK